MEDAGVVTADDPVPPMTTADVLDFMVDWWGPAEGAARVRNAVQYIQSHHDCTAVLDIDGDGGGGLVVDIQHEPGCPARQ